MDNSHNSHIKFSRTITNEFGDKYVDVYIKGIKIGQFYREEEMDEWAADSGIYSVLGFDEYESSVYGYTLREIKNEFLKAYEKYTSFDS